MLTLQTFRPNKKSIREGTVRYSLHRQANASLHSGLDLKQVVKLPAGEDLNEWIAVHGLFCYPGIFIPLIYNVQQTSILRFFAVFSAIARNFKAKFYQHI